MQQTFRIISPGRYKNWLYDFSCTSISNVKAIGEEIPEIVERNRWMFYDNYQYRPTDNAYTNKISIGIVSSVHLSRFDYRAGKSFLCDKHLPLFKARDAASYGESRPPRHIN